MLHEDRYCSKCLVKRYTMICFSISDPPPRLVNNVTLSYPRFIFRRCVFALFINTQTFFGGTWGHIFWGYVPLGHPHLTMSKFLIGSTNPWGGGVKHEETYFSFSSFSVGRMSEADVGICPPPLIFLSYTPRYEM